MSKISDRLYNLIIEKGISYGELSKLTGIPKSALQRYATGETEKIPIDRIEAMAKALNSSAAFIMGWEEDFPKETKSTDKELKVALFGGDGEVTDEMWDEVKKFAQYIKSTYGNKED